MTRQEELARRRRTGAANRRRRARNAAIAREYREGATLAQLAARFGLTDTGVWRVLDRGGWRLSPEEMAQRRPGRRYPGPVGGRPAIWPDCPEHLQPIYHKVRRVIGSRAAMIQLQVLEQRRYSESHRAGTCQAGHHLCESGAS